MAIKKHKIFAVVAVLLLAVMCFGLSACEEKPSPLTCSGNVAVAVGAKLEDVLNGVTVTFDSKNDEYDFTATGYENIRSKGVIVTWNGSTQKLKDNGTKCKIVFSYMGNSCSIVYYVGGTSSGTNNGGSNAGSGGSALA